MRTKALNQATILELLLLSWKPGHPGIPIVDAVM